MQSEKTPLGAIKLAYELALTGKFENVSALERELIAAGYDEGLYALEGNKVRAALEEVCAEGRERARPVYH